MGQTSRERRANTGKAGSCRIRSSTPGRVVACGAARRITLCVTSMAFVVTDDVRSSDVQAFNHRRHGHVWQQIYGNTQADVPSSWYAGKTVARAILSRGPAAKVALSAASRRFASRTPLNGPMTAKKSQDDQPRVALSFILAMVTANAAPPSILIRPACSA